MTTQHQANYGRVAKVYQWLEYIAFGRTLQKSREAFLERLHDRLSIGIFGAGDGRCFEPLLQAAPKAAIESIDIDPQFIALAQERVSRLEGSARVSFVQADARAWRAPAEKYDAILTQYFLDCFPAPDLAVVVANLSQSLKKNGEWIFVDFSIPEKPAWARWRGRVWIFFLCTFFRWRADHPLKTLPPMHSAMSNAGLELIAQKTWSHGLVRAAVYRPSSAS